MSQNSPFMDNLRQLFSECDTDQNGSLGRREFSELCGKIGLNPEAAAETFDRLDVDKDDKITFDEFAAGFNQYKQAGSSSSSGPASASAASTSTTATNRTTEVPARFLSQPNKASRTANQTATRLSPSPKKAASPLGVLSLGSTGSSSASSSSSAGGHLTSSRSASSGLHTGGCYGDVNSGPSSASVDISSTGGTDNIIVYSGSGDINAVDQQDYYGGDQATGSGQFGSLLSSGSVASYTQVKTMQDLLECVQKLQSENQILTQIFFKDKREREEYISQLGEEFDQQLREVEERANRRAREELENEKRRLSEMMQTERETLQHHYQTLEKMSKLVKTPNGKLDDGETIDKVKSKLEDTFMENRQLKRSLLDTKSDVALIWKEMEKLKKQYEDKLSSAYEKHNETKSECDHIKQQLNLMKDSNRKLQDASDVIANYITDKVEPVIKVANNYDAEGGGVSGGGGGPTDPNFLSPGMRGVNSAASSRRGSILSEYLNGEGQEDDDDNHHFASSAGDVESMASSQGMGGAERPKSADLRDQQKKQQPQQQSPGTDKENIRQSASENNITKTTATSAQGQEHEQEREAQKAPESKAAALKSISRHFLLGGRAQSDAKPGEQAERAVAKLATDTKAASADQATDDEPAVEPADGPSKATFNIILVGDSFVGKSSFAARFMEGSFVQGLISNCSIDFKTKSYKVDGINYTVNLWDTA